MSAPIPIIKSNWHYQFDGLQFSTQDFYSSAEISIRKRNIPEVTIKKITLSQGSLFSSKREYLRVSRKELVYDICAAPYGTGFFISYWHGETVDALTIFFSKIPLIGPFFIKVLANKTYYQIDTETMFKESVRSGILEAIDAISNQHGLKVLSDIDRRAIDTVK